MMRILITIICTVAVTLAVNSVAQQWAGGARPIQGVGDAGTPRGKVLTIQGITGGMRLPVTCVE